MYKIVFSIQSGGGNLAQSCISRRVVRTCRITIEHSCMYRDWVRVCVV